jgi:beta-phosphoglucomutase family hydrolase
MSGEATGTAVTQPVDFDALNASWRVALDAAADALRAAGNCGKSVDFPEAELRERARHLAEERQTVASLIDALAAEHHVVLHRRLSAPRATPLMLGLPAGVRACVFDLDGVLTASAALHAAAWEETFDGFLWRRVERTGERFAPFRPFDAVNDYDTYIHGRPRLEGVHAFLGSRGISLPEGRAEDPPDAETVWGLANHKNAALGRRLEHDGVQAYDGSRRYLEAAQEAGVPCAVVSPSENTETILERAGLAALIDERVDGTTVRAAGLRSKPAPDTLLKACRQLGLEPEHAAAVETTLAGVDAARAAGFRFVVGVDRAGRGSILLEHGADSVVGDLAVLLDPALSS